MDEIRTSLDKQIANDLEEISKKKAGDESRSEAINQVMDLHRMRMDELKLEKDIEIQEADRRIQTKLNIAGLVVPNGILLASLIGGFIIETNGVISGKTFERVLRFIKPEKMIKFIKF